MTKILTNNKKKTKKQKEEVDIFKNMDLKPYK